MTDSLIQHTIHLLTTYSMDKSTNIGHSTSIWIWVSFTEFLIIIAILFSLKLKSRHSELEKFKKEAIKQDIDFNNIINSSFNSVELYNELKVKCHPDRFSTDLEKNLIADKIFQEITQNKTNAKRLIELKQQAIQQLNIKF